MPPWTAFIILSSSQLNSLWSSLYAFCFRLLPLHLYVTLASLCSLFLICLFMYEKVVPSLVQHSILYDYSCLCFLLLVFLIWLPLPHLLLHLFPAEPHNLNSFTNLNPDTLSLSLLTFTSSPGGPISHPILPKPSWTPSSSSSSYDPHPPSAPLRPRIPALHIFLLDTRVELKVDPTADRLVGHPKHMAL